MPAQRTRALMLASYRFCKRNEAQFPFTSFANVTSFAVHNIVYETENVHTRFRSSDRSANVEAC